MDRQLQNAGLVGNASTIVDLIRARAKQRGDRPAMSFLERGEREIDRASYAELDRAARAVAGALLDTRAHGKPVLVALPAGIDFVRCFLGCLYAGAYAVPVPYPLQRRNWDRIKAIVLDAGPDALLTTRAIAGDRELAEACGDFAGSTIPAEEALAAAPLETLPPLAPSDIALIQYTSGSTSRPKGVVVTHRNLMANQAMIEEAFGHDETTVVASWLPLHHDMGLIGCVLQPLYVGGRCVFMSPLSFLQKPLRWLRAIAKHRATTTGAPNFGYDLCLRAIAKDDAANVDLSSLRLAFCGAEPVRPETMRSFAARFARCGFDAKALYPCYGLAEATLFVSGRAAGAGIVCRAPPPVRAGEERVALMPSRRELVSCGWPRQGADIAILALHRAEAVPPSTIGEICVSGDNVSPGFWSRPRAEITPDTARLVQFAGRIYLRTGDLGFVTDGELYIAGRLKDMMIVHGANIYAEDVEATVKDLPEARCLGAVAGFAIEGERGEAMVVICEWAEEPPPDGGAALRNALKKAVAEAHGLVPAAVLLVARGAIPRTASGKLQRGLARARYLQGILTPTSAEASPASSEPVSP